MKSNLTSATCGTEASRGLSGRRELAPVNPGHRPSASALGYALPARWADFVRRSNNATDLPQPWDLVDTPCLKRRESAVLHGPDALLGGQFLVPEAEILLFRFVLRDDSGGPGAAVAVRRLSPCFHRRDATTLAQSSLSVLRSALSRSARSRRRSRPPAPSALPRW